MTEHLRDRRVALLDLLTLARPVEESARALSCMPWDSAKVLVELESKHIIHALESFLGGTLSERDIENWANAIESREDIGRDPAMKSTLDDAIFDLANPTIQGLLTRAAAAKWIASLRS